MPTENAKENLIKRYLRLKKTKDSLTLDHIKLVYGCEIREIAKIFETIYHEPITKYTG